MTTLADRESIGEILREIREIGNPPVDGLPFSRDDDQGPDSLRGYAVAQTLCALNGMAQSIEEIAQLREVSLQYVEEITNHLGHYVEIARSLTRVSVTVGMDDLMAASHYARSADDHLLTIAESALPIPSVRMRDLDTSQMPDADIMHNLMVVQSHRRLAEILFTVVSTSVELVIFSLASVLLEEEAQSLSDDAWAVLERAKAMAEAA